MMLGVLVQSQEHLPVQDAIVELGEFAELVLDKADQLDIGIEMDGMHVHVHGLEQIGSLLYGSLAPTWVGLLVHFTKLVDGVVGVDLCGGQPGMPK